MESDDSGEEDGRRSFPDVVERTSRVSGIDSRVVMTEKSVVSVVDGARGRLRFGRPANAVICVLIIVSVVAAIVVVACRVGIVTEVG